VSLGIVVKNSKVCGKTLRLILTQNILDLAILILYLQYMNIKVNEVYKIAKNTFVFVLSFIHLPVLIMAESSALCCMRH
jgi:putative effector of murein hydrolase LrgA (UPF0299 family)